MGPAEEYLAKAVTHLHTEGFSDALATWIDAVLPNDNIALLGFFQDRGPELFFAKSKTPEVHADLESSYLNGAYLLDPFHELHLSKAPAGLYRLRDVAPDHFSRNQYFIEYYARTTMVDEIAFVSYPNKGVSLQLCLGRDKESNSKFTALQLKKARAIHPIVAALLNRHWSHLDTSGDFDEAHTINTLMERSAQNLSITLTKRQAEIIFLVLKGHSSSSIALKLDIAYQTVKVFRRQIYKKCKISSQAELFSMFVPFISAKK